VRLGGTEDVKKKKKRTRGGGRAVSMVRRDLGRRSGLEKKIQEKKRPQKTKNTETPRDGHARTAEKSSAKKNEEGAEQAPLEEIKGKRQT